MRISDWSSDVCSSDLPVTRIVDGVAVTQPCWDWQRSYTCSAKMPGNDCCELEAHGSCSFVREDSPTGDSPCSPAETVSQGQQPPDADLGPQTDCTSVEHRRA